MQQIRHMYVHGTVFHADDVLCVAIGKALNGNMTYERILKVPETLGDDEVVCDIGGGKYDHHQADAYVDENGHKFAACELLWRDVRSSFEAAYGTALAETVDELAYEIGLGDNGEEYSPIGKMFHAFNPCWNESKTFNEGFDEAATLMFDIITTGEGWDTFVNAYLERAQICRESSALADSIIDEAYSKMENGIVVFDKYVPWNHRLAGTDALFVITPSLRGGYNLQCVPSAEGSYVVNHPLLEKSVMESLEGCTFSHAARFLAAFDTVEHAKAAVAVVMAAE